MAPVGAQPDMAVFNPMEANTKAHIRRLINHIRAVLKQEAQMTELLIAQANTDPEEQGWLFAVRTWYEGWPQGMEDYIELGKRLLGAIVASAGRVKSTTLTLCAHDPFQVGKAVAEPSKATQQEAMHTIEVDDLARKMAKGLLVVEGCVRTRDSHLQAHHIRSGIEEAMVGMLHNIRTDPDALTAAGHILSEDQVVASRVLTVRVPQLWEDLVKFAHGKEVSFDITEGGRVQAHLPASGEDAQSLPFTPENRARARIASPLHDPDKCVGLEHPVALELLQFLISDFKSREWRTAIQCRGGIMRMTKHPC